MTALPLRTRILIADDEKGVLDAYRNVLGDLVAAAGPTPDLEALSAELFGDAVPGLEEEAFLSGIEYCSTGEQAVAACEKATSDNDNFAVVFLDMRMPPGIDGLETAKRIRLIDPLVNIVIVTGYSDYKPSEIADHTGARDRLFYLVKPFNGDELRQLTATLVRRAQSEGKTAAQLAAMVAELNDANAALQASEAAAQLAARKDALTRLYNRRGLEERFEQAVQIPSIPASVFYLDLDHFKQVNDTLGHNSGDRLLQEIAHRVEEVLACDGFAARLGGDEFLVVYTGAENGNDFAQRLLLSLNQPIVHRGLVVPVSVSMGTADATAVSLDEAVRRADIALYAAKSAGRGVVRDFDPAMEQDLVEMQRLAIELSSAISADSLALYYQPLMSADGTKITGVEALLRWHHAKRGWIEPSIFVPVAEKTNLINRLGDWVLRRAFADARNWPHIVTSINVAPLQLLSPAFAVSAIKLAREFNLAPDKIEFELTETAFSGDFAAASREVAKLKEAGFRIALDDYGSGYASLGYLSKLPFDKLKIDRSFVADLKTKKNAESVIRSIIGLAQAMGLSITAEGVEEVQQHQFLESAGCSQMQGYLFHRAQPPDVVKRLVAAAGPASQSAA